MNEDVGVGIGCLLICIGIAVLFIGGSYALSLMK